LPRSKKVVTDDRRGLEGVSVLVVEDSRNAREALTHLLRADGAMVVATDLGREALELARHTDFAVLFADLGLPDIPGDIVIRQILATSTQRPCVIAMTGYGEPHVTRAREAGADLVLRKPFGWEHLRAGLGSPDSGAPTRRRENAAGGASSDSTRSRYATR
jgi:two-component system, chemotaxis family, CheB/CheR fusion protein